MDSLTYKPMQISYIGRFDNYLLSKELRISFGQWMDNRKGSLSGMLVMWNSWMYPRWWDVIMWIFMSQMINRCVFYCVWTLNVDMQSWRLFNSRGSYQSRNTFNDLVFMDLFCLWMNLVFWWRIYYNQGFGFKLGFYKARMNLMWVGEW